MKMVTADRTRSNNEIQYGVAGKWVKSADCKSVA